MSAPITTSMMISAPRSASCRQFDRAFADRRLQMTGWHAVGGIGVLPSSSAAKRARTLANASTTTGPARTSPIHAQ